MLMDWLIETGRLSAIAVQSADWSVENAQIHLMDATTEWAHVKGPTFDPKDVTPISLVACQNCRNKSPTPGLEPHTCPYASEIHGDDTVLCNCCDYCAQQCADDI